MSDPRFSRLRSDPRFRRPRRNKNKIIVDERFKKIFEDDGDKKKAGGKIDKYGRSLAKNHEQENLRRFYRLEGEDTIEPQSKPDLARGEVLLESSGEDEDDRNEKIEGESDEESETGEHISLGRDASKPIAIPQDDDEPEIDLDESTFNALDAQVDAYNKLNPEEEREEPEGHQTRRLAVVNLDWDHVLAAHLYKIFSSLVSPTAPLALAKSHPNRQRNFERKATTVARGRVLSVRVYPSNFGKERMAREEIEGPPTEIFKKRDKGEEVNDSNIHEVGGEEEYDEDALRKYQLERLRYYYAIATCDTAEAAAHIYSELEGTELERSANVFDLSYVPDDMTFEDDFRDEADKETSTNTKGVEFVTDALRHSKVKLTWDDDDPERSLVTRRSLSRKEIEEANFKAYLASSTSGSETESPPAISDKQKQKKGKKDKGAERDKLRALLLGAGGNDLPEGWGEDDRKGDVDMEITFTPGLSEAKENRDETTLEAYERKKREKRKNEKAKRDENEGKKESEKSAVEGGDDFLDPDREDGGGLEVRESSRRLKKGTKKRKRDKAEGLGRALATAEELELLGVSADPSTEPKHFDLKAVIKAEKKKKRKGKKRDKNEENDEIQEDFQIDVRDDRFKALHDDHTFAIDPSNPQFKKTKSMTALLEERARRRDDQAGKPAERRSGRNEVQRSSAGLKSLVESVKRKSLGRSKEEGGKRRKVI